WRTHGAQVDLLRSIDDGCALFALTAVLQIHRRLQGGALRRGEALVVTDKHLATGHGESRVPFVFFGRREENYEQAFHPAGSIWRTASIQRAPSQLNIALITSSNCDPARHTKDRMTMKVIAPCFDA